MQIRRATFRLLAVSFGVIILACSAFASKIYWVAISIGAMFGLCGLLIDYFTNARFGRGQVSAWMLVAGGAALIFLNARQHFLLSDGFGGWAVISQYVASVALAWGVLLFVLPSKPDETARINSLG